MQALLTLSLLNHFVTVSCVPSNQPPHKTLEYAVNEESEIGSFVGNLRLDAERKLFIRTIHLKPFELYDASRQGYFRVDPESGKLFVSARIDREAICTPQEVGADGLVWDQSLGTSREVPRRSVPKFRQNSNCAVHLSLSVAHEHWINVIVTIHDVNDHQPYFPDVGNGTGENVYVVQVSESLAPGQEFPLVPAKDADTELNAVQTYELRGAEMSPSLFSIFYRPPFTLKLIISGELDAETKKRYDGELVACDGGQPIPKCGIQPLQIHVTDINDNKPVFNQSTYMVEINETTMSHFPLIRVNASDADSGPLGRIRYRFGHPISQSIIDHFVIESETGELKTRKQLNAKENPRFIIPIVAEDGGAVPLIGQAVVLLTVADVNDHSPWIEVRSMQVNTEILVGGNNSLSIEENKPPGTPIALIIVGDDDLGENSVVECDLKGAENQLHMEHANSANGQEIYLLSSNTSFDRESLSDGKVFTTVLCTDKGKPPRLTEKVVTVHVLDKNEFAPVFLIQPRPVEVYIEEGQDAGTFLFQTQASDLDATPSVRYHLSNEANAYFRIDENSGVVTTRAVLDREETPAIKFCVYASDVMDSVPHSKMASLNVTATVADINDNSPELTVSKSMQIIENLPAFSEIVGQLISVDKDSGNNGTIRYKLLSVTSDGESLPNDTFRIEIESGKLFVLSSLDREQHSQYVLQVSIYDMGSPESRNTTEIILVDVLDENDNRPTWESPLPLSSEAEYNPMQQQLTDRPLLLGLNSVHELGIMNISGQLHSGQRIAKLLARDIDALQNANLTYSLIASYVTNLERTQHVGPMPNHAVSSADLFVVYPTTGELSVSPDLISFDMSTLAEVYLRVSDNGNPPMDSTARLFIRVLASAGDNGRIGSTRKGIMTYVMSTGSMGIMLTVLLAFIMCTASICIVITFITLRRRSDSTWCGANCSKVEEANNSPPALARLLFHSQLTVDEGFALDGQLSALGTLYNVPKSDVICSDGSTLYRWKAEKTDCAFSGCVNRPLYNFSTPCRSSSKTKGDETEVVHIGEGTLLCDGAEAHDLPQLYNDTAFYNQQLVFGHLLPITQSVLPEKMEFQADDHGVRPTHNFLPYAVDKLEIKHPITQSMGAETDRGSADSGQGASEDEPTTFEWRRPTLPFRKPQGLAQYPVLSGRLMAPTCTTPNQQTANPSGVSTSPHGQTCQGSKQLAVTTFLHMNETAASSVKNVVQSGPAPTDKPSLASSNTNAWLPPLFLKDKAGDHNQLYDGATLHLTNTHVKQTAIFPVKKKTLLFGNSK